MNTNPSKITSRMIDTLNKKSQTRLFELRSLVREVILYREEGNIGAYEGVLKVIDDCSRDKKSLRTLLFLLTLQWTKCPPAVGNHHNNLIDGLSRLPIYMNDSVCKGFVIKTMSILLPLIGKKESAMTSFVDPILTVMTQDGYPVLKKSFFGSSGPMKEFDTAIKLWQDVFSAMRALNYAPEKGQLDVVWSAATSPDSIVLARHATFLLVAIAQQSSNNEFVCILLDRFKNEGGDVGKVFHMHDSLCRCYVLKVLAALANNKRAVPIGALKELYTSVYNYIESIEGMNDAKCVSDCIQYLVESSQSVALQHAFSTAGANNIYTVSISALTLQLDRLDVKQHASNLSITFRACMRLGKYFLRKTASQIECPTEVVLDSSNVSDYYRVTELCKLLNLKIKVLLPCKRPDIVIGALVALVWLSPTDDQVSTADAKGITDLFWDNIARHFESVKATAGEEWSMHFLDNLFGRLKQDIGKNYYSSDYHLYHAKIHSTVFRVAFAVLVSYPSPKSCQAMHNLWSWSSMMLRSFSSTLSDGVGKRFCQSSLINSLLLVTGRDLAMGYLEIAALPWNLLNHRDTRKAMVNLKRFGLWLLAEHAFFWVIQCDQGQTGFYGRRFLHMTTQSYSSSLLLKEEGGVVYEMPKLTSMTEVILHLLRNLASLSDEKSTGLLKLILRLLHDKRTISESYFKVIYSSLMNSFLLIAKSSNRQEGDIFAMFNFLTGFGLSRYSKGIGSKQNALHGSLDSTWVSQMVFEEADAKARLSAEEKRREQTRRIQARREASDKAAMEYRTFKVEGAEGDVRLHGSEPPSLEKSEDKPESEERVELSNLQPSTPSSLLPNQTNPAPSQAKASSLGLLPFINPSDTSDRKNDWVPTNRVKAEMTSWFDSLDCIDGHHTHKVTATKVVQFLSSSKEYLSARRIGLEQLRAIWNMVDSQAVGYIDQAQFFVFVRLLMIACSGKRPNMEVYYATYADELIPLPPFGNEVTGKP